MGVRVPSWAPLFSCGSRKNTQAPFKKAALSGFFFAPPGLVGHGEAQERIRTVGIVQDMPGALARSTAEERLVSGALPARRLREKQPRQ